MNKGKFASLIMLGAFSAGVASSSVVSAQGNEDLASVVDNESASSYDDSVMTDFKFSDESVSVSDENNIDTEATIGEETQDDRTDENDYARNDAENLDENIEDETDLPEGPDKESSENGDYVFVADDKKQNVKKGNGVEAVKGFAIAGIGASAVSGATLGISKLVKSSGNDKKDEPSPEPTPEPKPKPKPEPKPEPNKKEEKGGFGSWCINNLSISLPVTLVVGYISVAIIFAIGDFALNKEKEDTIFYYTPLRGRLGFKQKNVNVGRSIPKALWYEFLSALALSNTVWGKPNVTE